MKRIRLNREWQPRNVAITHLDDDPLAVRLARAIHGDDFVEGAISTHGGRGGHYGPDMVFPRELIEHGAPEDREAVLTFLEDISRYYTDPDTQEANARIVAADRLKEIKDWQQQIRDGKIPNHRQWR